MFIDLRIVCVSTKMQNVTDAADMLVYFLGSGNISDKAYTNIVTKYFITYAGLL